MWQTLKASCLHSLTIAWTYILAVGGVALQFVDIAPDVVNDPSFKQTLMDIFGNDPHTVGRIVLAISVVTFIARLRSLRKATV